MAHSKCSINVNLKKQKQRTCRETQEKAWMISSWPEFRKPGGKKKRGFGKRSECESLKCHGKGSD